MCHKSFRPYHVFFIILVGGWWLATSPLHAVSCSHDYTICIVARSEDLNGASTAALRRRLVNAGYSSAAPTSSTAVAKLHSGDVIIAGTVLSGVVNPGGLIDFLDRPSTGTLGRPIPFQQLMSAPDFRPDSTLEKFVAAARRYYPANLEFPVEIWSLPKKIAPIEGDTTLGSAVGKPFFLSATNPEITDPGLILDKGVNYILEIQGTYTNRNGARNRDALFQFLDSRGKEIHPERHFQLRLVNPTGSLQDFEKTQPQRIGYHKDHVYEIVVTGEGKPFKAFIADDQYGDNSGGFTIQVFRTLGSDSAPN